MALTFDPETGFSVDEVSDIRSQVAQQWKDAFKTDNLPELNTEPETPAGQLVDSQTASIAQKDAELLYICNQFNPLTAQGIFQQALGQIYFLDKKEAIPSTVTIRCTGLAGTVIPVSAQVRSNVDDSIWLNVEEGTIPSSGYVDLTFQCSSQLPL